MRGAVEDGMEDGVEDGVRETVGGEGDLVGGNLMRDAMKVRRRI